MTSKLSIDGTAHLTTVNPASGWPWVGPGARARGRGRECGCMVHSVWTRGVCMCVCACTCSCSLGHRCTFAQFLIAAFHSRPLKPRLKIQSQTRTKSQRYIFGRGTLTSQSWLYKIAMDHGPLCPAAKTWAPEMFPMWVTDRTPLSWSRGTSELHPPWLCCLDNWRNCERGEATEIFSPLVAAAYIPKEWEGIINVQRTEEERRGYCRNGSFPGALWALTSFQRALIPNSWWQ